MQISNNPKQVEKREKNENHILMTYMAYLDISRCKRLNTQKDKLHQPYQDISRHLNPVNCSASNWLGVNIEATGTT